MNRSALGVNSVLFVLCLCCLPLSLSAKELPLGSWADREAKASLIQFVESVTDPANDQFVAEADRIAVFDNDGTLWPENPLPFQLFFALDELKLDIYPNQIEIISAEQMLDAYSCTGLPLMYHHWSFGKRFVRDESNYRHGRSGLAYEIVINSNPCISYNMEENSMAMQILVMSHAAFGHNHFFKNNYLFRDWTDASSIHDYLAFAKSFIAQCEQEYGEEEVEAVLDAAHAL